MKKLFILPAVLICMLASCSNKGSKMKSDRDSLSIAAGIIVGDYLKNFGDGIDMNLVVATMKKVAKGKEKQLTPEEINAVMGHYFMVVQPAKAKEESEKFLAGVEKSNKNVHKTESGLLYEIIEAGDPNLRPLPADTVVVDYVGTLPDGQEFDSSVKRGEPAELVLNRMIQGWVEGIPMIGKGGKIRLWIPGNLGYGEQRVSDQIGPNQALVFEVELHDVKKAAVPAESAVPAE